MEALLTDQTSRTVVEIIPVLRAAARLRCGRLDDADDLVRATLMTALRNVDRFDCEADVETVLLSILASADSFDRMVA